MAKYKDYSYEQTLMIPVSFEKQILPGTFEYTLCHLIDYQIDLSIFANRYENDYTGAPAYDPAILLKIILYAYSKGINSSRKIAQLCTENIVYMALAADTRPHFTTIADFFVHSDNGNPMKGMSLMALFYDLGISNSYSRPRVSDDNPFIESWFKTLKTHVSYPGKFKTITAARAWFADFVHSYNGSHKHSGLHYITPMQVRNREYPNIVKKRNEVMQKAYRNNPIRWSNGVKQLPVKHVVYLNPTADTMIELKQKSDRKSA